MPRGPAKKRMVEYRTVNWSPWGEGGGRVSGRQAGTSKGAEVCRAQGVLGKGTQVVTDGESKGSGGSEVDWTEQAGPGHCRWHIVL